MGKLKNAQHEKFAQALIKHEGKQVHAYSEAYPDASRSTIHTNSSRLAHHPEVKQRIRELAEQKGLTLEWLTKRIKSFAGRRDALGLDATKFGFKMHGFLDGERSAEDAPQGIEVNVNILQVTP